MMNPSAHSSRNQIATVLPPLYLYSSEIVKWRNPKRWNCLWSRLCSQSLGQHVSWVLEACVIGFGDVPPVLLLHVHTTFNLSCSQTHVTEFSARAPEKSNFVNWHEQFFKEYGVCQEPRKLISSRAFYYHFGIQYFILISVFNILLLRFCILKQINHDTRIHSVVSDLVWLITLWSWCNQISDVSAFGEHR